MSDPSTSVAGPTDRRDRSERQVVAFLAFTGILLALGIDISLPAFDELRPAIGLEAESPQISLIVTTYFLGMALGQVLWGPLSDRFGRIPAMNVGVGLYIVAAVASALAPSLSTMLAARFVWGIGAAAPALLRAAVARDLYDGDDMARIMSLIMAIFMIGPVTAPLVGELILVVGPWQWVFLFCAVAGAAQIVWSRRFGETLPVAERQPLEFGTTARAFIRVLSTRATVGYTLAYGFASAAFFVFLGSSQPVMDNIYDREDQFAVVFGATGVLMAGAFLAVNRLVGRYGARRTALGGAAGQAALAGLFVIIVVLDDGVPSFGWWIGAVALMNMVA
ncbi:MAG: MFS transporter, partial [Actinomycetota bacterium]|nr:MFS transporter [Actinomycetota bacterium]